MTNPLDALRALDRLNRAAMCRLDHHHQAMMRESEEQKARRFQMEHIPGPLERAYMRRWSDD